MFDFKKQIEEFLSNNFMVATLESCNVKMSNQELLNFLFRTFPKDCISDYELNDIMTALKFERHTYSVKVDDEPELKTGWCLFSKVMVAELKNPKAVESD